jgi:type II secretory pathway pseudopilin PulG
MFSLIISIIAIALVAALAGAAVYYGGSAFTGQQPKAEASRVINESSQISAAILAYSVKTGETLTFNSAVCGPESEDNSSCLQPLIDTEYLKQIPKSSGDATSWGMDDNEGATGKACPSEEPCDGKPDTLFKSVSSEESCVQANIQNGSKFDYQTEIDNDTTEVLFQCDDVNGLVSGNRAKVKNEICCNG